MTYIFFLIQQKKNQTNKQKSEERKNEHAFRTNRKQGNFKSFVYKNKSSRCVFVPIPNGILVCVYRKPFRMSLLFLFVWLHFHFFFHLSFGYCIEKKYNDSNVQFSSEASQDVRHSRGYSLVYC